MAKLFAQNQPVLAQIPWTESHHIRSATVRDDFLVSVALPESFGKDPTRRYPVVYVLDGSWYFGMVVEMIRIMNIRMPFCNELPDAIVVGIGYPVEGTYSENLRQVSHRRMRDFTPFKDADLESWHQGMIPVANPQPSGGGPAFYAFLRDELMPEVEAAYHGDPDDRCLLGHSLGGLFTLYTAFQSKPLCQKNVVASPMSMYERLSWFQQPTSLPAHIYLSTGDLELDLNDDDRSRYSKLTKALGSAVSYGFHFVEQTFQNQTHCAVVAPAFQAGLVATLPLSLPE